MQPLHSLRLTSLLVAIMMAVIPAFVSGASKPHIVTIILDDWGYNNWGYRAKGLANRLEVKTPNLDQLAAKGLVLDRHYTASICTPTRAAFQTGRNPIHVDASNGVEARFNPADPISGFEGIPTNMTVIAEKMKAAGYRTHFVGKWHVGHASRRQLPSARGYSTSLAYFNAQNDFWSYAAIAGICSPNNNLLTDLWQHNATTSTDGPAVTLKPNSTCAYTQNNCLYGDELYQQRASQVIMSHDPKKPLFLVWAPHAIHSPLEPPAARFDEFAFINDNTARRNYAATLADIDMRIGMIIQNLKSKKIWSSSLVVVMSDNGGPISFAGGASNYPLRGGKYGNFEGGARVNALVSGGYLPQARRGAVATGLIAAEDWYATYCALAGQDPVDSKASKAGLPPVDSINMWPYLSGQVSWCNTGGVCMYAAAQSVGLLRGSTLLTCCRALLSDPSLRLNCGDPQKATTSPYTGVCLFDVFTDPTESTNLAQNATRQQDIARLAQRIVSINKTVFAPDRGAIPANLVDSVACKYAVANLSGFEGPWLA
ncbi:arylsulfatase B-like protein [Tribonema minus]|uniref:Arylsulfatase B-like protein n=1 Tax=Tribonema minus TaxID=303371 RepID=A0A835YMD4_9STRA|nr:arylsulfatase B-like protein [Tribonema minus]